MHARMAAHPMTPRTDAHPRRVCRGYVAGVVGYALYNLSGVRSTSCCLVHAVAPLMKRAMAVATPATNCNSVTNWGGAGGLACFRCTRFCSLVAALPNATSTSCSIAMNSSEFTVVQLG